MADTTPSRRSPFANLTAPIAAALVAVAFAGCFTTSSRPPVKAWTIEPADSSPADQSPVSLEELGPSSFKATRLGVISVMPPYDAAPIRVRRADGSLAEDAYNVFASTPSKLLRRPVMSALAHEQRFGHVVPQTSTASSDAVAEVLVSDMFLDCREGRKAKVSLGVNIIKGRQVILSSEASSDADASSGDYSEAFSKAFNDALHESLLRLK